MKKIFIKSKEKKKYIDELTEKIDELCTLYENYAWEEYNRKLIVTFQSNMAISFYLYDEIELLDDVVLSFPKKDFNMYKDICLRAFAILLGNSTIHYENNIYYNDKHKNSLGVIVGDDRVKEIIDLMVAKQNRDAINLNSKEVKEASGKVKRRVYNRKFIDDIGEQINVSRDFLRK